MKTPRSSNIHTRHRNTPVRTTTTYALYSKMSSQPHSMYIAATRLQIEQTIFSVAQSGEEAGQSTRLLDLITRIPVSDRPQILEDHVVWYIALNWGWFRHPDAVVTLINFARCNASYPGQPQLREQLETALATCLSRYFQSQTATRNPPLPPSFEWQHRFLDRLSLWY